MTYAKISLPAKAYEVLRDQLIEKKYGHKILNFGKTNEVIVLGDLGFIPEKGCAMPSHHWSCDCEGMGGDR